MFSISCILYTYMHLFSYQRCSLATYMSLQTTKGSLHVLHFMYPLHLHASLLISTVIIAHIQHVTTDQQSKASSNLCNDVTVQISSEEFKVAWVMLQKGPKCQLFVDSLHNQRPVKLLNLRSASSRTIFFIKGTSIENIASHKVNFKFSFTRKWLTPC